MSSSSSPCAACKFLRRKCTQECVFAPYFPPDQPQKFANVHKVFGASNVAKILNELTPSQREDAVNSLAYEAEARLRDPVYGCVGLISILQHKLKQVQHDLINAKKELATYIGPSAMLPLLPQIGFMQHQMQYNNVLPMLGGPGHNPQLMIREPQQQQQMMEAQQQQQLAAAVAAREQQEMMRSYEQQQQEMVRFTGGFDQAGAVGGGPSGYSQVSAASAVSPVLALRSTGDGVYQVHQGQQDHFHHQLQLQPQTQLLLQQQNQQEEGPIVGPS